MLTVKPSVKIRTAMLGVVDALSVKTRRVWGLFFLVSLASTWVIQLVLLTWLFPQWSDGNGLLRSWDVGGFHTVAALQAKAIVESGWQAWELRPEGWGVSGLLSAWYAVTVPSPWAFAPVQSVLYATGMSIVFILVQAVCQSRRHAVIAVLPFLLFPSAATLYAQPHRDIFVFCAIMLAMYGWWQLLRVQTQMHWLQMLRHCIGGLLFIAVGFVLGFVVRRLAADMLQLIAVIMVAVTLLAVVLNSWQGSIARWHAPLISVATVVLVAIVMLAGHQSRGYAQWTTVVDSRDQVSDVDTQSAEVDSAAPPERISDPLDATETAIRDAVWVRSDMLPRRLDDSFRRLTGARNHLLTEYAHSRTLVDESVLFTSATDVVAYLPRAMQIGLLAPFPSQWLPHAEAPPFRNVQRVLAGVEMALIYPLLPFFGYAMWVWRGRPALWLVVLPASAWVAVYAITVPMVGALVRYRYVALILLVSLALAGLLHWVTRRRARRGASGLDAETVQTKSLQAINGVDRLDEQN